MTWGHCAKKSSRFKGVVARRIPRVNRSRGGDPGLEKPARGDGRAHGRAAALLGEA
jgi:hypothetical protein